MVKLQEAPAEIQTAAKEFYSALNDVFHGNTASMEQIWSHEDDVTYLGPQGGILSGWNQVSQAWKEQAKLKLQGKLEQQNAHFFKDGNIGVMQCMEIGTNQVQGKTQPVKIRALNIFRKENGKWKMISHQTDRLSFLQ